MCQLKLHCRHLVGLIIRNKQASQPREPPIECEARLQPPPPVAMTWPPPCIAGLASHSPAGLIHSWFLKPAWCFPGSGPAFTRCQPLATPLVFNFTLQNLPAPAQRLTCSVSQGFHLAFLCLNLGGSRLSSAWALAVEPDSKSTCVSLETCMTSSDFSLFLCKLGTLLDTLTITWLSGDSVRGCMAPGSVQSGHHQ